MDCKKMVTELRAALRLDKPENTNLFEEWHLLLGYAAGCKLSHDQLRRSSGRQESSGREEA